MRFPPLCSMFLLAVLSMPVALKAQTAPDAAKLFSSSADVQALIEKAKSERKNNAPTVTETILSLSPYKAMLEYRTAAGPAAIHETEAEFFYVIEGSATLVTGGKLLNETYPNASNIMGTALEGGTPRSIARGDFIVVPQGTPHWFSAVNGTLVLMSLHVPRTQP